MNASDELLLLMQEALQEFDRHFRRGTLPTMRKVLRRWFYQGKLWRVVVGEDEDGRPIVHAAPIDAYNDDPRLDWPAVQCPESGQWFFRRHSRQKYAEPFGPEVRRRKDRVRKRNFRG